MTQLERTIDKKNQNNMTNVKSSNVKSTLIRHMKHFTRENDINDTTTTSKNEKCYSALLFCAKRVKLAHRAIHDQFRNWLIKNSHTWKISNKLRLRKKRRGFNHRSKMAKKAKQHPGVCQGRLIAVRRPQLRMQIFPRSKLRPFSPPINCFNIAIRQREHKIGCDD